MIRWVTDTDIGILLDMSFGKTLILFIAMIFHGFFAIMVAMLVIYHTYLIVKNMTTCQFNCLKHNIILLFLGENVSWAKISYLKNWPEEYGSPFSMGIVKNLKYFLGLTFTNEIKIWKLPKFEK